MTTRITRGDLFMSVAKLFADRSTCPRAHVGAVIVKANRIIGAGYNGAPPGLPHCLDDGCKIVNEFMGCGRAIHAETNAIVHSQSNLERSTIFTTHAPCLRCAMLILSSGIEEVVYSAPYRDSRGLDLLAERGVWIYKFGEDPWLKSRD